MERTICEEKFNQFLLVGRAIKSIKAANGKKPATLELVIPDDLAEKLLACATVGENCKIGAFYLCWKDFTITNSEKLEDKITKNTVLYSPKYGIGKVANKYEVNFVVNFYNKVVYYDYAGKEYNTEIDGELEFLDEDKYDFNFNLSKLKKGDRVYCFGYGEGKVIDVCNGWRCLKVKLADSNIKTSYTFNGVEYDVAGDRLLDTKQTLIKLK